MVSLWQDIRYGFRTLVRNPGFALPAILCLGLGIGACTAVFSVVNTVLLRPLPFTDSDRLVLVGEVPLQEPSKDYPFVSKGFFLDLREQVESFEEIASVGHAWFPLTGGEFPERFHGLSVSANFFRTLGVEPMLGRTFLPGEDQAGKNNVVVMSHGLWQRRFGGDPNQVGKTIVLTDLSGRADRACTVIGIMPPSFQFSIMFGKCEMWQPHVLGPRESPEVPVRFRLSIYLNRMRLVVARLKADVTQQQAQAETRLLAQRLAKEHPETNEGWTAQVLPLRTQFMVGQSQKSLWALLGVVVFVLLIACANVANMLLARAASREKEVAVRAAVGASRWRLVRQFLIESLLLAFLGAGLGLLLTHWGIGLLKPLVPARLPLAKDIGVDAWMLGCTLIILVATGVGFGLVPSWQLSKPKLTEALKEGGYRSVGGSRRKSLRGLLVISEVALALVLLAGAGLMIQSVVRLLRVDPGFNPRNMLRISLVLPSFSEQHAMAQQMSERIGALPGVQSVVIHQIVGSTKYDIEGQATQALHEIQCGVGSSDYFRAMGIGLLKGRHFVKQDTAPGQRNIIINETAARLCWPGEDPIGKRIREDRENYPWLTVVGVVRGVRFPFLDHAPGPVFHAPYRESERGYAPPPSVDFVVRARPGLDPLTLIKVIRREAKALAPNSAPKILNMEKTLFDYTASRRIYMKLISLFASTGLVLAAVGLFGIMSYSVARRTHEIGIRMALGAERSNVFKLIIKKGLTLIVIGMVIGLAGALALTRVLRSLLYDVAPTDPVTLVAVSLLLMTVGLIACYIPARRATRINPISALRYE